MLKNHLPIATAFLAICLYACDSGKKGETAETKISTATFDKQWAKSFIDSVNAKFSQQIAAGDSVALASHYWPDAELMLDYSETIKGNNIANAWGEVIRMGIKEMTFSTTDIKGNAQFLIETGNAEMKDAKKSVIDRGKYVVVWEKRNGEWKLYRDIGCTSLPIAK
jgi:ketosteroid isomerase-like protein